MNQFIDSLIDNLHRKLHRLKTVHIICAASVGFLLAFFVIFRAFFAADPIIDGSKNSRLQSEPESESRSSAGVSYEQLLANSDPSTRMEAEIGIQLRQLEAYLTRDMIGDAYQLPDWFSDEFVGTGIDQQKFAQRTFAAPIEIQRWQTSASAPRFTGSDAFDQLVRNCFKPWRRSSYFWIQLRPYKTEVENDRVKIQIALECFGLMSSKHGRQGSGIWSTEWISKPDASHQLVAIKAIAQEEVDIAINSGILFRDCTDSILSHCGSASDQLGHGLDRWAERIPNLDIVGNQGLAVSDINRDGLDDLYICQAHGLPNLLLIQSPDGTTQDISHWSGVDILDQSFAALILDLDNDGNQDLAVTTVAGLVLLVNQGEAKFQMQAVLPVGRGAQSLSAADYDQDGDLDLYLCKPHSADVIPDWLTFPQDFLNPRDGGRNVLLRNDGDWSFTDVTEQAGITANNEQFTHCAVWLDYDLDGDQDLYVANEYSEDQLLRNDGGVFSDIAPSMGMNSAGRHRTVSVGEFNRDGRLDLFVGNDSSLPLPAAAAKLDKFAKLKEIFSAESQVWFSKNPAALATNATPPQTYATQPTAYRSFLLRQPLYSCRAAYSSCTADLNNDGLDDLIVTNGFLGRPLRSDVASMLFNDVIGNHENGQETDWRQRLELALHDVLDLCRAGHSFSGYQQNRCFLGIGGLGFANVSAASGLDFHDDARGIATSDWDQDGDADIIITSRSAPQLRIFCNQLDTGQAAVSFALTGTTSNRDAIGSRVELFLDDDSSPRVKILQAGSGSLSQSSKQLLFGLGNQNRIGKAIITWPDGNQQIFESLEVNRNYHVVEGQPDLIESPIERENLAIKPNQNFDKASELPTEKSVFYPPSTVPHLQFQGGTGKFYPLLPADAMPIATLFFDSQAESLETIEHFEKSSAKIRQAGLDCVGLFCDTGNQEIRKNWLQAKTLVTTLGFSFRWGVLTPASIDKLKYCSGHWFARHELPELPFALLINSQGEVVSYYPASELNIDKIIMDLPRTQSDAVHSSDTKSPRGGYWAAAEPSHQPSRLPIRLLEVGYSDDPPLP